jgi:glycosyltransferase 2 family protein
LKPGLTKAIRSVVFLLIGILLIWIAFRGISFRDLSAILLKANYSWLIVSVVISIGGFAIRSRRWMLLMEPLGQMPSFKNTYHSVLTGYLANMLFPRLGEVSRCAALSKKEGMPFDKLIGTVILERTIDLISVLIIMAFLLVYGSSSSGAFLTENIFKPMNTRLSVWFGFSGVLYIILTAVLAGIVYLIFKFRDKLSNHRLFKKAFRFMSGIADGLKTIAGLKRKWEFIILTILLWSAYLLMAWVPVFCLESTSGLDLGAGIFILVIGSLGMAVPVQSGIGAFHWIVSRGINFVYGIPLDQGLAYATIEHESQMIMIAILGSVSLVILFGRKGGSVLTDISSSNDSKE